VKRLVIGMTFKTKCGLDMYAYDMHGELFVCLHRPLSWQGYYRASGEFLGPCAFRPIPIAPNKSDLDAEFFEGGEK